MEKLCTKKELSSELNENKVNTHDHLRGMRIKALADHLTEEIGDEREFRCLPEMPCDSTSESVQKNSNC